MSKKRGLSLEEKKTVLLSIFHESKDVFLLKDLEKLGPKRGVIQQSIKEVLQALVDDDLVHQDKIGTSNFFWAFPSEAAVKLKNTIQNFEAQLQDNQRQTIQLKAQVDQSRAGKESTEDRTQMLDQLAALDKHVKEGAEELSKYADNDPEKLDAMNEAAIIARDSANRWLGNQVTDNLELLKSWCKKRFEGMERQLDEYFAKEGAATLEYID